MICRMYGEDTYTHFKLEWTPLAYCMDKVGYIFNWVQILSFNIFQNAKEAPGLKKTRFLHVLIFDRCCLLFHIIFLLWDGTRTLTYLLSMYISLELWDNNYKKYLYDICDHFLAPLFSVIFNQHPHRLSQGVIEALKDIGDWYMGKHYTYIRVFGCAHAPHILPKYVPNKLLGRDIAYQTMEEGITSFLAASSKRIWPRFPIKVGRFTLLNIPHARK
jgi:hypothetical protein